MERSAIVPHVSWSGPQPDKETDSYLLAMLLRIHSSGLESDDDVERDKMLHPSILTIKNLPVISIMYAYYKNKMAEQGVRDTENMLRLIKASAEDCVADWLPGNEDAVRRAEAELLEFVETPGNKGFSAFG
jgi:hypothetical protein